MGVAESIGGTAINSKALQATLPSKPKTCRTAAPNSLKKSFTGKIVKTAKRGSTKEFPRHHEVAWSHWGYLIRFAMATDTQANLAFDLDLNAGFALPEKNKCVVINKQKIAVTPVFYAYWRFAAERQNVFYRRLLRSNERLTDDPVLKQYKFTNTYRASDRVSQYLIRNVIYRDDLPSDATNLFFRILLFKLFNKIETWQHLETHLGVLTWDNFDHDRYDAVLTRKMSGGETIYSAAYIMPSGGSTFGHKLKHQNHLRMIASLVAQNIPSRLQNCRSMSDAYALLLSVPSIGPFLAYQYVTDFNYSALTDFSENEFVVAGPGALDGMQKCFIDADKVPPAAIIKYMTDSQSQHFAEQGIDFLNLWGRPLQLIDCQNLFCEISKYARVAFPHFAGSSGRTRIKQKFSQGAPLPHPWYPPKWNINSEIDRQLLC